MVAIVQPNPYTAFVTSLYKNLLGHAPGTYGLVFYLTELAGGASTSDVARQIYGLPEAKAARDHKTVHITEKAAYRQAMAALAAALVHKPADAVRFVEGGGDPTSSNPRTNVIRIQLTDAEADASNGPSARPPTASSSTGSRSSAWPTGAASTRTSPPTWASPPVPSSGGSTPTSTAASTPSGPARPRATPRRSRPVGRGDPPLGDRWPGRPGARPGQLDPRGVGRPPEEDPGHLGQPLGHAAVLPRRASGCIARRTASSGATR